MLKYKIEVCIDMDSMLYYEICFFISVILSFIYICVWHEGIDVNMTCLFILIPIVCLGCVWMYWAPTPEIAVLSNKIVYWVISLVLINTGLTGNMSPFISQTP